MVVLFQPSQPHQQEYHEEEQWPNYFYQKATLKFSLFVFSAKLLDMSFGLTHCLFLRVKFFHTNNFSWREKDILNFLLKLPSPAFQQSAFCTTGYRGRPGLDLGYFSFCGKRDRTRQIFLKELIYGCTLWSSAFNENFAMVLTLVH